MRKIALILLVILLFEPNSALAFFWRKKKKKQAKVLVNEEVLIHGKFKGQGSKDPVLSKILELRLAIHIPRDSNNLSITTLYDEASENPIEEITWIREGKNSNVIKTHPFKTESIINHRLEELSINYNPSLAYDRITEGKHVINKSFHFKQSDAIGDREKKVAHFLELDIPSEHGIRTKRIRIDNKLYYSEPHIAKVPAPHEIKQSKRKRKEEETKRKQEQALREQRNARLEAEHQQEMADLEYAIEQMNGGGDPYLQQPLDPAQFRQSQIQQQLDAFGPNVDLEEDIY